MNEEHAAGQTRFRLMNADCREAMKLLPGGSVDSVATDPPYELGFMGKTWDANGIAYDVNLWRDVLRVLKPGGHLLAFGGSRTYHRLACAIEDAGFEIRDQIQWIYGSGFPKSHNLEDEWDGWGTALKPAHEPIVVARKPPIGTVAENVLRHGTGALNIDGCRVEPTGESRERIGEASQERRYAENGGTNFAAKPGDRGGNPAGRWPANVIHDGSEEVLATFPNAPGQQAAITGNEPTANGFSGPVKFGGNKNRVSFPSPRHEADKSAARFFYCAKASRKDRDEGCEHLEKKPLHWSSGNQSPGTFQSSGTDKAARNHHPTVKPTELMRYLCRLVTPPGGTVLDPFMGSGSTGKAARAEGFRFIGIEKESEYYAIACRRIGDASGEVIERAPVAEPEREPTLFSLL